MTPLVSICIPTYNGVKYISKAITSALAQTYRPLEIIISDDASKDETIEIIKGFKDETDIPIFIYSHNPSGIGANWNHCVEKSKGEFIKFLFQDDILLPSCIEKMVAVARGNAKVGLVYSKRHIVCDHLTEYNRAWVKKFGILHQSWDRLELRDKIPINGRLYLRDYNIFKSPLNKIGEPSAVMLRKDCFTRVGYFDESLKQALDLEFWFRLMKDYNFIFIDENLVSFRLHVNQASFTNKENNVNETELLVSKISKNYFWYLNRKLKLNKIIKAIKARFQN